MRRVISIKWKIMIFSFGVVFFSIIIAGVIAAGKLYDQTEERLGERGLITGRTVANLPEVQQSLVQSEGWETLNPIVNRVRTINGSDYIVVLNLNRIRYSHPVEEKLGTVSSGKDEGAAFAEHSYVSKAKGELGVSIRSFVPIMNAEHEQIGVVIVGNIMPNLVTVLSSIKSELALIALLALGFGSVGSWLLARRIKQETFQLEPHEISRLLVERTATFEAMNEGVIAIDLNGKIMIFNDKAKRILDIAEEVTDLPVEEVIKGKLLSILKSKDRFENEETTVGQKVLLISKVPIIVEGIEVGGVAVFQDRTEVAAMAEELTGVKNFVEALRVQNHESLNRLHTIAGLIQLDEKEKALDYVFDVSQQDEDLSNFLSKRINDFRISGLILSKVRRGKELGINVTIDRDSVYKKNPILLDSHDLVLILGNLIENAFYSFHEVSREDKLIHLSIIGDDDGLYLSVEDNGCGMKDDIQARVLEKGFSTKGKDGNGLGLYLINRTIERANGTMKLVSYEDEGTSIEIVIPMSTEGSEHDDD
ncbi:ATP-binding protein [Alkalihalobacillus sp. CinArs1]|uniref:ATP-binding protein n=1 Tax=Alkalihalobacillus sp. CinArs1 TaxID=2995314 RepID=UPI0022DE8DA5|nr:sensor histidine kinase [Alkalihalobacillus sp. CinArs1]